MRILNKTASALLLIALPLASQADVVAFDMVGSSSMGLVSYNNIWTDGFASAGDGFQKYQRGVSATIPFGVLDDSLTFVTDSLGIVGEGNTDEFFGVTDTVNGNTSGPVSATWVFDISGFSNLSLSLDVGAMGDFEASDFFSFDYSIDGGASNNAFLNNVDEASSHTYTLAGGGMFTLNDPMLLNGTVLTNNLATFMVPLLGAGDLLTLTLTASTDGGSEAFAFQNMLIQGDAAVVPVPAALWLFMSAMGGMGLLRRNRSI